MRINLRILLLALPLVAASCSDAFNADDGGVQPPSKTISVTVGAGPRLDIEAHTALDPDGETVKWVPGDKIALWAVGADNTPAFSAAAFSLWHYNAEFDQAKFTGDIPQMTEGVYNYYAVSPTPAAVNGTQASFDIPTVQDGTFNGAYDIMVAEPVQAGALTEGDNSDLLSLSFSHKVHILKITIPSNSLNEEVSELVVEFPQPIAGRLTVNAADPSAAPVLSGGSSKLSLRFAQPLAIGQTVYAMIAPVAIPADQEVKFTAIGQTCESKAGIMSGKDFAAGHTTPIKLNIPSKGRDFTRLVFALPAGNGTATLGEAVSKITLTAPAGALFDNGSNVREFAPGSDGRYTIMLKPSWTNNLSGKTVTVQHESANAVVSNTVVMPAITPYAVNTASLTVPYLMSEDFSSVQTYSNNEGTTGINHPGAIWIPGLSGWSAARTGGSSGQSVRIVCRREGGMWIFVNYMGRMDSAPLTGLKSGASVKVKISFNYSGSTSGQAPKLRYGTSTVQGALNDESESIQAQAGDVTASTNGSYGNVTQSITPFTATASNQTRLSWLSYGSNGGFSGGWFYYIYIDNVKVSITQ